MQLHAPAHATDPVPARFWAAAYAGFVVALVFVTVAALASRSQVFGSSEAAARPASPAGIRLLHAGAYELQVRALPKRIGRQTTMTVELVRDGRSVDGARVRVTFAMPAMPAMRGLSTPLRPTVPGVYAHTTPILTVGRWRASLQVTPPHGKRFEAGFAFRVAA